MAGKGPGPRALRNLWTIMAAGPKAFLVLALLTIFFVAVSLFFVSSGDDPDDPGVDLSEDRRPTGYWTRNGVPTRSLGDLDTQDVDANLDEEMAKRRWTIDRVCRHLWLHKRTWKADPKDLSHIIVDDRHGLMYCFVAKVASTNWKRILMILQGNSSHDPLDIPANESHRANLFRTLDGYSEPEIDYRLRHYFKFLFARHPFERVLSAFRNKFEKENAYFHRRFGSLMLRRYRDNASEEAVADGDGVRFAEFARYLVDPRTRAEGTLNEHWRPVHDLCQPCAVRYDVVGKYEGLDVEAPYVLRRAGVQRLVRFPRIHRTVDTFDLLDDYFRTLTPTIVFRLYQLYALDFKMFGYEPPRFDDDRRNRTRDTTTGARPAR